MKKFHESNMLKQSHLVRMENAKAGHFLALFWLPVAGPKVFIIPL